MPVPIRGVFCIALISLLCDGRVCAQSQPNRGPDILTIPTSAPLVAYTPFPFAKGLAALESFVQGASPKSGTRNKFNGIVTWSVGNPSLVTIDSNGLVTPISTSSSCQTGCVTAITARYGRLSATVPITVYSPTSITVVDLANTKLNPLPHGDFQEFGSIVSYSGSVPQPKCSPNCNAVNFVAWSSSNDPPILMNALGVKGLVQADATSGSSTIGCTLGTIICAGFTISAGPAALTSVVSLSRDTLVAVGGNTSTAFLTCGTGPLLAPFVACGHYSDGSASPLAAAPASPSVSWTSSDTTLATISNSSSPPFGQAHGVKAGIATITATPSQAGVCIGIQCISNLNVGLNTLDPITGTTTVPKGTTSQLHVMGMFSDGILRDVTNSTNWTTSAPTNVKISSTGLVTAVGLPTSVSTISATFSNICPSALCVQATVTVGSPVLVSIAIKPVSPTIPLGDTQQFTATGTYSDGSTQNITNSVTWSSDTPGTICFTTCKLNGKAVALARGEAVALAMSGTANVTATDPATLISNSEAVMAAPAELEKISVTPKNPSQASGNPQQFTAKGTYSDGSNADLTTMVTWTASEPNFASITNGASGGLASTMGLGSSEITATLGSVSNSTLLTVTAVALNSITISAPSNEVFQDGTLQYTATGNFSDGSKEDYTQTVTWSATVPGSSPPTPSSAITISNSSGSEGLATGLIAGTADISATDPTTGKASAVSALTVNPTLISISVTPASPPPLQSGQTQPFTATGNYSDSSQHNITSVVQWSSDTPSVATVDATGLATAVTVGMAKITATDPTNTISGSVTLTVIPPALQNITVAPANQDVQLNQTEQYTATGNYADGSTQDLTNLAMWSTASGVNGNTIDPTGLLTANQPGPDTVTATCPSGGACPGANSTISSGVPVEIIF